MKTQCLKEKLYPPDIARMALWLAADDSRLVTGQNFVVDGGQHVSLAASLPARAGRTVLGVFRQMWPPTLYFFIAFNLIVFTTNLLVHDYWFGLSGFLIATTTALVVGKSILVANEIRLIDRFRGAPLIQPILYRTIFYTLIVLVVRILGAVHPFGARQQRIHPGLRRGRR